MAVKRYKGIISHFYVVAENYRLKTERKVEVKIIADKTELLKCRKKDKKTMIERLLGSIIKH